MIGKTNGGSSGSGSVIKVFSASNVPESGKYGQIAVINDDPCKYWEYAAEAPTARADGSLLQDGDIFLKAGVQGNLNALKRKAAIRMGLDSCYRWSGNAWLRARASYFDTAWHEFSTERRYLVADGIVDPSVGAWAAKSNMTFQDKPGMLQPRWVDGISECTTEQAIEVGTFTKLCFDFNAFKDDAGNYLISYNGAQWAGQFMAGIVHNIEWGSNNFVARLAYGYNLPNPPSERATASISLAGVTDFHLKLYTNFAFPQIFNIWLE